MTKAQKIALAGFTLWPIVYMFIFMFMIIGTMVFTAFSGEKSNAMPVGFLILMVFHVFTMLETFGLIAFYIYNLFHTDRIAGDKKALWAVVLFMGNVIAMPVYWYLYIWKEKPEDGGLKTEDGKSKNTDGQ